MTETTKITPKPTPAPVPTMPENAAKMGCTAPYTFTEVKLHVKALYEQKHSLRRIAREDYGGRISHAVIQRVLESFEPRDVHNREVLGLPAYQFVVVVTGGVIPPGAQVVSAEVCECGQWYIPNHPARKHCFICSPYKRRKEKQAPS